MVIAALGPEGTFSYEMAEKIRKRGEDILLFPTISSVFAAVEKSDARGIVPVENSEAGGVGETMDGLLLSECLIVAEYLMPVRHHLASMHRAEKITVIYAHPQSHAQCSRYIESLGVPVIHTSSNSKSAKEAAAVVGGAAITTESAAKIYSLPVLIRNIQNSPDNTTRFVEIIKKPDSQKTAGEGVSVTGRLIRRSEKCSLIVDPMENRPGLLYDILGIFAKYKLNLTKIESRPSKRGIGNYIFFIDCETDAGYGEVLSELKDISLIKELGCYQKAEV
ncbi:ACT domain-containing protein [Methanoplanus sp. FWC-SCC4]|uniref:ACT domain-containing protein n=1 Tax=Methanochimaera problematica TaxID=2609417 RepID=A0AA97I4R6_9EURY|nr:prephenate dehydratase domain-containing protein [Methanoplanus sp. FWC-SCC4]WOF17216.1 ACT domain-containing protein [Methanoplanus sp. FWC-SCC4]